MARPLKCFFLWLMIGASFVQGEEPVGIYLTWTKDPAHTMVVQWITTLKETDDKIEYQKLGIQDQPWQVAIGSHRALPENCPFLVHRVNLDGLEPFGDYQFRISSAAAAVYKFRTMPQCLTAPFCFVAGGDIYHDEIAFVEQTNRQIAKTNPLFAIIGGDLAYSCSTKVSKENARRWIDFFAAWKKGMVTADGRLIPLVPVIGNHDVKGKFGQTAAEALFFHAFFPFPGEQGYNLLDFGDYLTVLVLDSGHTNPISGLQARWINEALADRQFIPHKFAAYHVPAFPSYRNPNNSYSVSIRRAWVPLFEKYNLDAAFEHHEHTYKRTYRIRDNGIDNENGVLYLGDGAWGVENPRKRKNPVLPWYLKLTYPVRHFIMVNVEPGKQWFTAIDSEGNVIDQTALEKKALSPAPL